MTRSESANKYKDIFLIQVSTAIGAVSRLEANLFAAVLSRRPSQNLGSLSPGMNILSTASSVIIHIRIVPPEEPSREIASAKATFASRSSAVIKMK